MKVTVVARDDKLSGPDGRRLKAALDEVGIQAPWSAVDRGKRARAVAARAVEDGADVVLVAGGDGTVRAVSEALVGTDTALAVFPVGTANLFANGYDLPTDPAAIVELVLGGRRRVVDTGRCNDRTFNVMAGTGLDAAMIEGADAHKERLGVLAYVRAGVRHARRTDTFDATVELDGEAFFEGSASCVLVGNIGTITGGVVALPDASPTDGRLDVAVVTAAGLGEWASVMASALRRRQAASQHAHLGQGTDISVRLDTKQRFQLDGGAKGKEKRLDFAVRPMSLILCADA